MTLQQMKYAVTIAEEKSMNKAATTLFVTQPNLSNTIRELEAELGTQLFIRSNRGVVITPEGEDFLGYARQMVEWNRLIEERYLYKEQKKKFSVSMQHYTFAVQAFIELTREFGMDEYEFTVYETKSHEVITNVRNQKSEIGILYLNDFNQKALEKLLRENELDFVDLFQCDIYVYLAKTHPLAAKEEVDFADLEAYPYLSFEQGDNNSFYLSEEVFSTHSYKKVIKANDRATMLNLMVGLNGYTLCSGIICEELNGEQYKAVPFHTADKMRIGYIKKKRMKLSDIASRYIELLEAYSDET
jgi:DNA-binding transcriptional LysR family regulator